MPILRPPLYYTSAELKFLLINAGFSWEEASHFIGFDLLENIGEAGSYRLEINNPLGGDDLGLFSLNTKSHPDILGPDRYRAFDVMWNIDQARALYLRPGVGYGPWNFGPNAYGPKMRPPRAARTEAGIRLVEMRAVVPVNPYWKMRRAGVPTYNLPVPPRDAWVSPLPAAGLKLGDQGTPTSPLGIAINTLSRRYITEDCWVTSTGAPAGTPTWYYGNDWVRSSMEKHQRRLKDFGLYAGPIDGRVFTEAYRTQWDAVLRYVHLHGGI